MSPSLEGVMFNRSANLSGRQPLLELPCRLPVLVPPGEQNGTGLRHGQGPPPPPRPRPPPRHPDHFESYACRAPDCWKPSNMELERRLREEKVGYFLEKITPPQLSLDRREAELVFRFDPHASGDYLSSQYHAPGVHYSERPPPKDGPFVFGVHGPAHFRPANGRQAGQDDDYDYSEVAEESAQAGTDTNCCDRVNEWTVRDKPRARNALSRMFQIDDKRKTVNSGNKKKKIKCVLVGDGAVGKTSLITAYAQDTFREDYQPTAYDTYNVVVAVDDRPVNVEICDTAGQESMSELRALCYPGTDVLVLCFSVVQPDSFRSIGGRWVRAAAALKTPLVLVGTQTDLATDPAVLRQLALKGERVVTEEEARALANKINAVYVETSAKTRTKLKDAFDLAILAALPVITTKKPFWKKLLCIN